MCLNGLVDSVHVCGCLRMVTEREALVTALAKFTQVPPACRYAFVYAPPTQFTQVPRASGCS